MCVCVCVERVRACVRWCVSVGAFVNNLRRVLLADECVCGLCALCDVVLCCALL